MMVSFTSLGGVLHSSLVNFRALPVMGVPRVFLFLSSIHGSPGSGKLSWKVMKKGSCLQSFGDERTKKTHERLSS